MEKKPGSTLAVVEALLVTFLWSSSYVFIKIGLREVEPLSFAAVRYILGFLILMTASTLHRGRGEESPLPRRTWHGLAAMGLLGYTLAQGLQFVGLSFLPAVTTTLILNFTPLFVLILAMGFLAEVPSVLQGIGMAVALGGAYLYFEDPFSRAEVFGVSAVVGSGLAWAGYLVLVRAFQRTGTVGSLRLTRVTMGIGSLALLASSLLLEGFPSISASGWAIIAWLSAVNTAFAFYLWNHALRALRAFELSMLQNTMLIQIAVLAWLFLGEQITGRMTLGMALVLIGVALAQTRAARSPRRG